MPYIPDQQINTGSFVQTTNVWDLSGIKDVDVTSPEFKELLIRLYQNVNNIAVALNTKDTGYYLLEEFATGRLYFNPASDNPLNLRPSFRKMVNTGALGAGVTTTAHGLPITNTWKFISIVGAASNTGTLVYYPITAGNVGIGNIQVHVTAANVVINNASGVVFTDSMVDLEYLKF